MPPNESGPAIERSKASSCTTPPTPAYNVDATVRGTVTWVDGGQDRQLSAVDMHIHADRTALFSLCVGIGFRGWKQRVSVYVLICPEIIQRVSLSPPDDNVIRSLHFVLTGPLTIATPEGDIVPKNRASNHMWESCLSLARQREFTILIHARGGVPGDTLDGLCRAISAHELPGPSHTRHVDGLYSGQAARISCDADSWMPPGRPPSYQDLDLASSEPRPPKRPRSASLASALVPEKRVFAASQHERHVPSDLATGMAAQLTDATAGKWVNDAAGRDLIGMLTLVNTTLSGLSTEMSVLRTGMTDVRTEVSGLRTEVSGLRTEVSGLRTEVSGLRAEVSDLRTGMTGLRTGMTDLRTEVSDLRTSMTDLRTEVSDLRTDMMDLRTEISALRTLVKTVSHPDAELQEQIDELRDGQDRHSVDLDSLREDVNTSLAVQEDLEEHICTLVDEKVRDSVHEALDGAEVAAQCEDVTFRIVMGE